MQFRYLVKNPQTGKTCCASNNIRFLCARCKVAVAQNQRQSAPPVRKTKEQWMDYFAAELGVAAGNSNTAPPPPSLTEAIRKRRT